MVRSAAEQEAAGNPTFMSRWNTRTGFKYFGNKGAYLLSMMSLPIRVARHQRELNSFPDADLSFAALPLRLAGAKAGGKRGEEEGEGNYYVTGRKSYEACRDELPPCGDAGVPESEIPAVLDPFPHGGIGSEHIAKLRASGDKLVNLLSRYCVRAETIYVHLKIGIGKALTKLCRFHPGTIVELLSFRAGFLSLNQHVSEKTASFRGEGQSNSRDSDEKKNVKKPVTILYDVKGDSLQLADADWRKLLTLAIEHGWEARGTDAPPRPIGLAKLSWDGRYDDAAGQLVRADDAKQLGEALRKAVQNGAPCVNREVLPALISWTASRGFIICRKTPGEASMQKTAGQLSSLGSKLSSFYAEEPSEVYSGGLDQAHLHPVR